MRCATFRPRFPSIRCGSPETLVWVKAGCHPIYTKLSSKAIAGELTDAPVIMAIVVVNAGLGVRQERKAERSLAALKQVGAPEATVVRDGEPQSAPVRDLVRGDTKMRCGVRARPFLRCRMCKALHGTWV